MDMTLFGKDHGVVLERWDRRGFEDRQQLLANVLAHLPAGEDLQKTTILLTQLFAQAKELGEVTELSGPTGETNELYLTGRGNALVYGDDTATPCALAGLIVGALLCGNAVVVHAPAQQAWITEFCGFLHQIGVPVDVLVPKTDLTEEKLLRLAEFRVVVAACNTDTAVALGRALAERDGILVQLYTETDPILCTHLLQPDFLLRLITEKTRTNNITAIGGNATLLELGGLSN